MDSVNIKPAMPKYCLVGLAGILWNATGIMLCRYAFIWIWDFPVNVRIVTGSAGLVLLLLAYRFGFNRIARKNIGRINFLPDKSCIFAFQAWRSYLIIGVMVALGIFLRHSGIPKYYLVVIYFSMGGALFISSFHYFNYIWSHVVRKQPGH